MIGVPPLGRSVATALAASALGVFTLASCTGSADGPTGGTTVVIDVYAAASLTEVFTALAADFEAAHPGTSVELTFAGSSDLAAQIAEGAPADVFASANTKQMDVVLDFVADAPADFASNVLTIAVPAGNPAGVTDFASLARPDVVLVTCAPAVPCGAATAALESALGVDLNPASEEPSVTDVLGKVAAGDADAGLVYVTDIARTSGVSSIDFEGAELAVTTYPIAALTGGDAHTSAEDFVAFILSEYSQAVLRDAGFRAP